MHRNRETCQHTDAVASAPEQSGRVNWWNVAAVVLAILPSWHLLAFYPPTWNHIDSLVVLEAPLNQIPHHPPLYVALVHAMELAFGGISDMTVYGIVMAQHAAWILSVVYLAFAFRQGPTRVLVPTVMLAATPLHLLVHGIYFEALFLPAMVLLFGAFVRLVLHGRWRNVFLYHLFLLMVVYTRHAGVALCALLPMYCLARFAWDRFRRPRKHLMATGVCIAGAMCVLVVASAGLRAASHKLDKEYSFIIGRVGAYRLHFFPWDGIPDKDAAALLSQVRSRARDPLLARTVDILVDPEVGDLWMGPHQAIRDMLARNGGAGSPDDYMNAAYFLFMTTPNLYILDDVLDDFSDYFRRDPTETIARGSLHSMLFYENDAKNREILAGTGFVGMSGLYGEAYDRAPLTAGFRPAPGMMLAAWLAMAFWALAPGRPAASRLSLASGAVAGTGVVYAASMAALTIVLPRYVAPLHLLVPVAFLTGAGAFFEGVSQRET
ncbi:MAG: hypothetical protein ACLFOY_04890 [Desulfatibacillaceae bacterium]